MSAAAGSVVLAAYAKNNTQVANMHTCMHCVSQESTYNTNEIVQETIYDCSRTSALQELPLS